MLEFEQIKELIAQIDASSIGEVKIEAGASKITIKKSVPVKQVQYVTEEVAQPVIPTTASVENITHNQEKSTKTFEKESSFSTENTEEITSPMVGTFYHSSSPETPPFVKEGDMVKKGDVLCILEAMKLFNEIDAEMNGQIVKVLVGNGELVEYGQPLFLIKKD